MPDNSDLWCQTFAGRAFLPFDPRPEDVCDADIAHALSLQCRFGGHCREFYSVAEHSLRVANIVPPEHALAGLLHDAAEAYLVDLPRPIKLGMPEYTHFERKIARAIGERYGVPLHRLPDAVKDADNILLATEKRDLMAPSGRAWSPLPPPLPEVIRPMSMPTARQEFLERLFALSDGRFGCAPKG